MITLKKPMLTYAAIVGLPILLFLFAVTLFYPLPHRILGALLGLGLIAFGIVGFGVVYAGRGGERDRLVMGKSVNFGHHGDPVEGKTVEVRVGRFNRKRKELDTVSYITRADDHTTVLDALLQVRDEQDNTLSFRHACGMGSCGSCAMEINGRPALACETKVRDAARAGSMEVAPMLGFPLAKDLITDMTDFLEKHAAVRPGLHRNDDVEKYAAKEPYAQSQAEVEKVLPYAYCIMCGLCLDACPVVNSNSSFIGPQALSQAYRYQRDSRDQLGGRRLELVDVPEGMWECEFAGSCSDVCPKGVGPGAAIQLLKAEAMRRKFSKEKS